MAKHQEADQFSLPRHPQYLLVPAPSAITEDQKTIEISGRRWVLEKRSSAAEEDASLTPYLCVSYACGDQITPHPFDSSRSMSTRAIPVIEAAIREADPHAIWLDAFCIPAEEPARSESLGFMGSIYNKAESVVVVLSGACQPGLEEIKETASISTPSLSVLEKEPWINRAWTYQEMGNCDSIRFTTETGSDPGIQAEDLLNLLGGALQTFQKSHGLDGYTFRSRYPRVSALEDLLLDWKMALHTKRSAYLVISAMHHRESLTTAEKFYAMVGSISNSAAVPSNLSALAPSEFFMRICEDKKDYSFIYCKDSRDPNRPWRPSADTQMRSVLPWHSFGNGQAGVDHGTHLELEGMWAIEQGPLNPEAIEFFMNWLKLESLPSEGQLTERIARRLQDLDFDGWAQPMKTRNGFFFATNKQTDFSGLFASVATGVQMAFGAPGLLLEKSLSGVHSFKDVGFFVGRVPKVGEVLKVG